MTTTTQAQLLTPAQVGHRCPPNRPGVTVGPTTVSRWITSGVRLRDGSRLRLRAIRFPGGWRIAEDDFEKPVARLTTDPNGSASSPTTEAPRERFTAKLAAEGW